MKTFLSIPSHETRHALTLGAMLDTETGHYFVPPGQELAKFDRWLPTGAQAAALPGALTTTQAAMSLGQMLMRLTAAISHVYPSPEWVRLEFSGLRASGGHVYFDAVDRDEDGKELAKCRAVIWKAQASRIGRKFVDATGTELATGMKVLVLAQPQYHPQHGFSLVIVDLDPGYTLGDMHARLKRIREAIDGLGIADKNKALPAAADFCRVGVIAPHGAAGLDDFQVTADALQRAGLCHFEYFHAVFQGEKCEESLRRAFIDAHEFHVLAPVDALVVIRGGGAQTDLQWLNQLLLAKMVCRFHAPVLTGIGHERDVCIMDEYANRSFGTPSKVIAHIKECIATRALQALRDWETISHAALAIEGRARADVLRLHADLRTGAQLRLYAAQTRIRQHDAEIRSSASSALALAEQRVRTSYRDIRSGAETALTHADKGTTALKASIAERMTAAVAIADKEAGHRYAAIAAAARGAIGNGGILLRQHHSEVMQAASRCLAAAAKDAAAQHNRINEAAARIANAGADKVEARWQEAAIHVRLLTDRRERDAHRHAGDVRHHARAMLAAAEESSREKIASIMSHGVEPTLKRGFAMVTVNAVPVSSMAAAYGHAELEITFRDGALKVRPVPVKANKRARGKNHGEGEMENG
ncbi:exodeoxyribonuclease VII large subunit [Noviherbaspirillum galbum]|uniref:Exodeoxyribonuclease VII large subunit n=1 Tax=Noviherbaspirillum galbum TaxID=2709383 RepID=A0A6B3SSS3_9BURK|nr:exodeoxyribonuclease VII large subunit [Noviherbaspirillum galbum]NEX63528.1 exodeoxyribonuclease VII large subunit [Noviherbaspirillum galbum]